MHEIGVIDNIISVVRAKLGKVEKSSRVKKINLVIGELEYINRGHLEFHFKEHVKGTMLEHARLKFKKAKTRFRCKSCGYNFSSNIESQACPECNSRVNEVVSGIGVYVESIELH